jgi:hypothetical protein
LFLATLRVARNRGADFVRDYGQKEIIYETSMDRWVLKQLRAQILGDLKNLIPEGYFDRNKENFQFSSTFPSHEYLSSELCWGYNATKLGQEIYFKNNEIKQPKFVAAAEVLMNLGMLSASDANQAACKYLSEKAKANKIYDGNSTAVYKQITTEHIPTFEQNIKGALKQYLK